MHFVLCLQHLVLGSDDIHLLGAGGRETRTGYGRIAWGRASFYNSARRCSEWRVWLTRFPRGKQGSRDSESNG